MDYDNFEYLRLRFFRDLTEAQKYAIVVEELKLLPADVADITTFTYFIWSRLLDKVVLDGRVNEFRESFYRILLTNL